MRPTSRNIDTRAKRTIDGVVLKIRKKLTGTKRSLNGLGHFLYCGSEDSPVNEKMISP